MSYSKLWHIPGPQRLEVFSQTDLASSVERWRGGREHKLFCIYTYTSKALLNAPVHLCSLPIQLWKSYFRCSGRVSDWDLREGSLCVAYHWTRTTDSHQIPHQTHTWEGCAHTSTCQTTSYHLSWTPAETSHCQTLCSDSRTKHRENMETCPSKWLVDCFHLDEANVLLLESARPRISISGPCVSSQQGNWGQHFLCSFVDHVVNLTSDLTYTRPLIG